MSQEKFNPAEPGMSHPLTGCAVRLTDDGRVVIMAGDLAGIVIDEKTGVVTIFGTEIRFASSSVKIDGRKISEDAMESPSPTSAVGLQLRRINKRESDQ
jgi:hypothetical protein